MLTTKIKNKQNTDFDRRKTTNIHLPRTNQFVIHIFEVRNKEKNSGYFLSWFRFDIVYEDTLLGEAVFIF